MGSKTRSSRRRSFAAPLLGALVLTLATAGGAAAAGAKPASGAGSAAALSSPDCDADRGTIKLPYSSAVPCVKPFADGADNGGATYQGVTADTISVVVRKPSDETVASGTGPPRDAATGELSTVQEAFADSAAIFEHTNQQWGRTVEFSFFESSGSDEAAQRADAVAVLADKPFAVIDVAGGDVFQTLVAQDKVLAISPTTGTNNQSIQQSPYRWTATTDYTATALIGAEFVGKQLVGKPAVHAGGELEGEDRVFGLIRSMAANAPDFDYVTDELSKYKVSPAVELSYDPASDSAEARVVAEQNVAPMVGRLKDAGVTSVIMLTADYQTVGALTRAMKQQEYFPELITMGSGLADIAFLSRDVPPAEVDQDVWSHAFGVLTLYPPVEGVSAGPSNLVFRWFWGEDQGTYWQTAFSTVEILYSGIHMAGPDLTPKTFKAGMFARPATSGAADDMVTSTIRAYGKKSGLPYDEYMVGGDAVLAWWSPTVVGPSVSVPVPDAPGNWMFLNDAHRYQRGEIPTKAQPFFDESKSFNVFPAVPPSDVMPDYPCDGCPVNGGSAT